MPVQQAIKMARKIFAGAKMLKRLHIRLLFLRTSVESRVHSTSSWIEQLSELQSCGATRPY